MPAAARTGCATIFVAIELSRSSRVVAVHTPLADKVGLHKLPAGDRRALLALIERHRAKADKVLGAPVAVVSGYEAGYDGFWLHRLLAGQGGYDFQPRRADFLERLDGLSTGDGRPLPERLRREIERQLERLALVQETVAGIEAERDAATRLRPSP